MNFYSCQLQLKSEFIQLQGTYTAFIQLQKLNIDITIGVSMPRLLTQKQVSQTASCVSMYSRCQLGSLQCYPFLDLFTWKQCVFVFQFLHPSGNKKIWSWRDSHSYCLNIYETWLMIFFVCITCNSHFQEQFFCLVLCKLQLFQWISDFLLCD